MEKIKLDFDIIGGQGSLTIDEEKALSAFFKQRKFKKNNSIATKEIKKNKPARKKEIA